METQPEPDRTVVATLPTTKHCCPYPRGPGTATAGPAQNPVRAGSRPQPEGPPDRSPPPAPLAQPVGASRGGSEGGRLGHCAWAGRVLCRRLSFCVVAHPVPRSGLCPLAPSLQWEWAPLSRQPPRHPCARGAPPPGMELAKGPSESGAQSSCQHGVGLLRTGTDQACRLKNIEEANLQGGKQTCGC